MCTDPTIAAKAAAEGEDANNAPAEDKNARDAALGPPPGAMESMRSSVSRPLERTGFGRSSVVPQGASRQKSGQGDDQEEDGDDDSTPWEDMSCDEKFLELLSIPWNKIFEWTIPDVNTEELREELEKIMDEYEASDKADKGVQEQISKRSDTQRKLVDDVEVGGCCVSRYITAFSISILWIGTIATFMVLLAERCGCIIGIPAPIMGVTVLAAGTSIPDALGSIIAAKSRQGDMAVANAIGSNVFDILIGLGLPYGIYGVTDDAAKKYNPAGYVVALDGIIAQMVILFLTVIATFVLFMFFKWRLTSGLGYSMLAIYAAFCIYSVITANNPRWYSNAPHLCNPVCASGFYVTALNTCAKP